MCFGDLYQLSLEHFGGAGLSGEKILGALSDHCPDLGVSNLPLVLDFVWSELGHDRDCPAGYLNSTWSPGWYPALRRMLFGAVRSAFVLTVTVMGVVMNLVIV